MATDPTGRTSHLPDMHRGQGWKQPVRVATASNTWSSGLGTVDGVSITSGDRVLLMGQTSSASNGIYVASSGWWPRAHDMDQDATTAIPAEEVLGAMVYVVAGASNGGKMFRTTNTTAPTLGTTALTFSEFAPSAGTGFQAVINGGLETLSTVAASGSTETLNLASGNWHDVTLTAACTITVSGYTLGSGCTALVALRQDSTGGWGVTWDPSVLFTGDDQPDLTANTVTWFVLWSGEGDATIYGAKVGGGGSASPLTTKGDLWGFSTVDARFAVGSNGTGIVADSTQTLGLRYTLAALAGELLMQDGVTNPPVPVETETQDDWLYQDL